MRRCAAPIDVIGEPSWNTGFEKELTRDLTAGTGGETRPGELVDPGRSPLSTPGRVLDAGDRCRAARDVAAAASPA